MRRNRISYVYLLGFYVLLILLAALLDRGNITANLDQLIHDRWVLLSQRETPDDVVILGVDPDSLQEFGRWPWPRVLQAQLFNRLAEQDVKAVAIDVLYVEPDGYRAFDDSLERGIAALPITVMPVLTETVGRNSNNPVKLPLPRLTAHADSLGHIVTPVDSDGIVRRMYLKSGYRQAHWPAMSLSLLLQVEPEFGDGTLPGNRVPFNPEPGSWQKDFEVMIPFYGQGGSFTTVSAKSLLIGEVEPGSLKDKIVFVGVTSTGIDVLPTPVSATDRPMPGVEIHANLFSSLRDGSIVSTVDHRLQYVVIGVLLLAVLLLFPKLSPAGGLISAALFSLLPLAFSFVLYRVFNLWYGPMTATLPLLASYVVWSWQRLEYVAQFLKTEVGKLGLGGASDPATRNEKLAQFFENSVRHLPLTDWHFSASGQTYQGGEPLMLPEPAVEGRWERKGKLSYKRFSTAGRLYICFAHEDDQFASELGAYIDSLSQVQDRQLTHRLPGFIEKLQSNASELSYQVERLRRFKGLTESIFGASPAGLVIWGASGQVLRVNRLGRELLPDILNSRPPLLDFIQAMGRDPHHRDREDVENLILHGKSWQISRTSGDSELVVNFNAGGKELSERLITASVVDVSEIRRIERSRAEMIDFMSHDLRSPLVSSLYLINDPDMTGESGCSEEARINKLGKLEVNINNGLKMIDDLLTLSRADNLQSDSFTPVLFDDIIGNALDRLAPFAQGRHIKLDVEMGEDDMWVYGDASLLERAIINIIDNAIKYSPDETTVSIDFRTEGDRIIGSVQDQGVGISKEMLGNLFQRFKRDSAIAKQYRGTGLGLALVARVMTEHGGHVSATSEGVGTTINMDLPLMEDPDGSS